MTSFRSWNRWKIRTYRYSTPEFKKFTDTQTDFRDDIDMSYTLQKTIKPRAILWCLLWLAIDPFPAVVSLIFPIQIIYRSKTIKVFKRWPDQLIPITRKEARTIKILVSSFKQYRERQWNVDRANRIRSICWSFENSYKIINQKAHVGAMLVVLLFFFAIA